MSEVREHKNDGKGWAATMGFHAILLLLFFFIIAWQEPNPPLEEYGIEINFGTDLAGEGEVQPETPAAVEETIEDPAPEVAEVEPVVETETVEEVPEETVTEEPVEETVVTQPAPSPVVVEEKPKVVEKKPEPKKEEPKVDPRSAYPGTGKGKTTAANQGDTKGAVGDQGDPQGELDARALHGTPGGGGGGTKLEIVGWRWDKEPNNKDSSNENGFITFEFKIDDEGYVTGIRTLKSTVSPQVADFYRRQLQNTTFSPKANNARPAPSTVGKVTFTIQSN